MTAFPFPDRTTLVGLTTFTGTTVTLRWQHDDTGEIGDLILVGARLRDPRGGGLPSEVEMYSALHYRNVDWNFQTRIICLRLEIADVKPGTSNDTPQGPPGWDRGWTALFSFTGRLEHLDHYPLTFYDNDRRRTIEPDQWKFDTPDGRAKGMPPIRWGGPVTVDFKVEPVVRYGLREKFTNTMTDIDYEPHWPDRYDERRFDAVHSVAGGEWQ